MYMLKKLFHNKYLRYALVGLVFLLPVMNLPWLKFSTAFVTLAGGVVYLAIAGLGYNVLLGYSGQISLGHAGFMGLAAYMSAYLTQQLGWAFLPSVVVSVLVPFVLGLVIGLVAVRLQGFYLAIATLGFGEILRRVFIELDWFTNGFSGAKAKHPLIFGHAFTKNETYMLMVVLMVALMMIVYNLVNSHTGRALIAMKSSEHAARAMGIDMFRYKLIAFSVSSLFAGLSGVCYVHFLRYSDPTVWISLLSLNLIAMVVIGGAGTVGGAVVGAVVIRAMPDLLKEMPVIGSIAGLPVLLSGAMMIVILMFYSKGLVHIPSDIALRVRKLVAASGRKEA